MDFASTPHQIGDEVASVIRLGVDTLICKSYAERYQLTLEEADHYVAQILLTWSVLEGTPIFTHMEKFIKEYKEFFDKALREISLFTQFEFPEGKTYRRINLEPAEPTVVAGPVKEHVVKAAKTREERLKEKIKSELLNGNESVGE